MSYYFLSDLHISDNTPNINSLFLHFLQNKAPKSEGIFILGDLFEYWVGDTQACYKDIINEFNKLYKLGVKLYFIPGNRDFLITQTFLNDFNLIKLPDPYKIVLNNISIIISHGDLFCINDKKYILFRKIVQNKLVKFLFLNLPLKLRLKIGTKLRVLSAKSSVKKNNIIMDVNKDYINQYLNKNKSQYIIHGHTHKPGFNIINNKNHF